jgi:DNA invertase Pin-like site-specific DNA recombinase
MSKIVLETMQELLLKIALQMSRDDYDFRKKRQREGIEIARKNGKYQGRRPNKDLHKKIIECHILHNPPLSISKTAELLNTTVSMVTRVCGYYKKDKNYLSSLEK